MPGTMPSLLYTFSHIFLITPLRLWSYHWPHFTAEQTETQSRSVTPLRNHTASMWWSQVSSCDHKYLFTRLFE